MEQHSGLAEHERSKNVLAEINKRSFHIGGTNITWISGITAILCCILLLLGRVSKECVDGLVLGGFVAYECASGYLHSARHTCL